MSYQSTHYEAADMRLEIIDPNTVDRYLAQLMMPDEMRPHLKEQMETRGFKIIAGFLGERLVSHGLWNPDSPTREDTRRHIPHPTPSISLLETDPEFRGRGFASRILDAVCTALREEGNTHAYLVATQGETYDRPDLEVRTLGEFYTNRGFENWGRGALPLVQHQSITAPLPGDQLVDVYVKSLTADRTALDILLPLPQ